MSETTLPSSPDSVRLLETMRLESGHLVRLDRHLARMAAAATHVGYPWRPDGIREALQDVRKGYPQGLWRVRLLVDGEGTPAVTVSEHADSSVIWRIAFANYPVASDDDRLRHKTTAREPYDMARRGRPDVDDVVLWNERGEVTESTIANVVAEIDGVKCTPPTSSGLLPGVLRAELLESGALVERVLTRGMVSRASSLWLINSLRGWIEATLVR